MAKQIKLCHLTATIFFFLIICQSSTARPSNGFYPNKPLSLALPGDEVSASTVPANPSEKKHVQPCEMGYSKKMGIPAPKRLGAKYGPLLLSVLPKGDPIPPSGPSKRINDINN
uniref:Uncharacterized protein n=1 Tax=Davidia involucrata TaxID=16924 RepID=A0A5B7CCN9_DAVIN